jgi:hypothetical protein
MRRASGRHRPGRLALATALAGAWATGCTSVGAHVANLEAVHTDDGFHRLEAALYSDFEWEFRQGVKTLMPGSVWSENPKTPKRLDDPTEVCLEQLVELQSAEAGDEAEGSSRTVALARWAVECPWALSRERALLGLVAEARRLELSAHLPGPPQGEAVGPEELGDALAQLVAAVRPALTGELALDMGKQAEACERLAGLQYDLDGARRATELVGLLVARAPAADERFLPLRGLHLRLQRLTVHRAMSAGLLDRSPFERSGSHSGWESPRVRAAAVRACVRGMGPGVLAELLATQLDPRLDAEVLIALLGEVRLLGHLPIAESGLPPADEEAWRERWIDAFVLLATGHHDGQVRVAAMRALSAISGGELESLREEDWLAWREARRSAPAGEGGGSASTGSP